MSQISTEAIDSILDSKSTTIARDLKLNLKRLLEEGSLAPNESLTALLALASSVDHQPLVQFAREQLGALGVSHEQIQEAAESAAIMGMLNTYYKFKHMIANDEDYKSAGLRMTALAKPHLGKEHFEMLAFAVSVLNGCESCIKGHERFLRDHNVGVDKIHDLARMASVIRGLKTLHSIA